MICLFLSVKQFVNSGKVGPGTLCGTKNLYELRVSVANSFFNHLRNKYFVIFMFFFVKNVQLIIMKDTERKAVYVFMTECQKNTGCIFFQPLVFV